MQKRLKYCAGSTLIAAILVNAVSVSAQTIEVRQQPYAHDAPLPFGQPVGRPAGVAGSAPSAVTSNPPSALSSPAGSAASNPSSGGATQLPQPGALVDLPHADPSAAKVSLHIDVSKLAREWRIVSDDTTISTTLVRWSSLAGYQTVWQAQKDLPAYEAIYKGSFEDAVEALMRDSRHSGYPLRACLYDNRVVRVLHTTQSCEQ